jgi:hypothetical protein
MLRQGGAKATLNTLWEGAPLDRMTGIRSTVTASADLSGEYLTMTRMVALTRQVCQYLGLKDVPWETTDGEGYRMITSEGAGEYGYANIHLHTETDGNGGGTAFIVVNLTSETVPEDLDVLAMHAKHAAALIGAAGDITAMVTGSIQKRLTGPELAELIAASITAVRGKMSDLYSDDELVMADVYTPLLPRGVSSAGGAINLNIACRAPYDGTNTEVVLAYPSMPPGDN